jgi:glycosyltransferase involved in cell wall biosynthesis
VTLQILAEPLSEDQIVARWHARQAPQVSVCMLAYNHAPYIRDALNSVLNQKTNFGFEILVHDDASQDGTAAIIRDYATRYPNIVKPIFQTENQHSQRIYPSVHFNYPRARLPFVAMCEGDDYWSDESKLQLQVDGLRANPDINLSFHAALRVNYEDPNDPDKVYGQYANQSGFISFTDILHRVCGWIPFASCMIRQTAKERFLEFLRTRPYLTVGEIYFQLFGALPEGALFIDRPMSVYRFRTAQSWTRRSGADAAFKARHELAMMRSYAELDALMENNYHEEFTALILQRLLWLFNPEAPPRTLPGAARLEPVHEACQQAIQTTLDMLSARPTRYVIFGCASGCERVLRDIPAEKITAIIDRDNRRVGESLQGKPIVGTHALRAHSDCDVIVSTIAANRRAIASLATAAGIPFERIHYLFDSALRIVDETPIPAEITEP